MSFPHTLICADSAFFDKINLNVEQSV